MSEPAALSTPTPSARQLLPQLWHLPRFKGLFASVFLLGLGTSFAIPYLPLYGVNRVGMSPLQLGLFLTLNAVGAVVISTLLGRRADRLASRRPLVLLCLAVGAAGQLALSALTNYAAVVPVGMLLLAVGSAAFPQLFAHARALLGGGDLPERALTVLRAAFSLAWVVGPGVGALVLAKYSYAGIFYVTAACFLLAGLPVLLRGGGGALTAGAARGGPARTVPARPIALVALAFTLYGMSMVMGMAMFGLFVTKTLTQPETLVGALIGFCALLEIPVMIALVTSRRLPGMETLIRWGMGLFVVHFALVYFAQGPVLLYAAQALRAVVLGILAGIGMNYFQALMPGRVSSATTLFANTVNVGGMLSGLVSGTVAQLLGYRDVFLVCAALTFAAWAVMAWVTRAGAVGDVRAETPA